jgi:hypothetical protein
MRAILHKCSNRLIHFSDFVLPGQRGQPNVLPGRVDPLNGAQRWQAQQAPRMQLIILQVRMMGKK